MYNNSLNQLLIHAYQYADLRVFLFSRTLILFKKHTKLNDNVKILAALKELESKKYQHLKEIYIYIHILVYLKLRNSISRLHIVSFYIIFLYFLIYT